MTFLPVTSEAARHPRPGCRAVTGGRTRGRARHTPVEEEMTLPVLRSKPKAGAPAAYEPLREFAPADGVLSVRAPRTETTTLRRITVNAG
jgi:hypothetical protein